MSSAIALHAARPGRLLAALAAVLSIAGCGTPTMLRDTPPPVLTPATCAALQGLRVDAGQIVWPGLTSGPATVESATWHEPAPLAIAERAPTPAAQIVPAQPAHCRAIGQIAATTPGAEPIRFQVNLPQHWGGRTVQFGGGGFNGTLINALGLVPGARYDEPSPLALGFVTVGTDSGHQTKPDQPPQVFALNDEMFVNFAHAAYPKVRNVAVAIVRKAYGRAPGRQYFVGSSEGGREGLVMAQRYPQAFDGIFSRVPVVHWTGLQFAGARNGAALMDGGWLNPTQVKRVEEATLAVCDRLDGLADGIISDPVACLKRFQPETLRCATGGAPSDSCLSDAQVKAVQLLRTPMVWPYPLAHGLTTYPGWGIGGEATPAAGPTGGWRAWWTGNAAPTLPPTPANGIAWVYGAGALSIIYARDPKADPRSVTPESAAARVREVSALMDATNPDLSAFHARGGKLIVLEHMADYAQSPFAGIQYVDSVRQRLGADKTAEMLRLYTAPGVDHVGTGAPALVDMLGALSTWVEQGRAPGALRVVEMAPRLPLSAGRARPLCAWPLVPRYKGSGSPDAAESFACQP